MARYLVTGGCGFIGSHLVETLLQNGDSVIVLDNLSSGFKSNIPNTVPVIEGDIQNAETVAKALTNVDGCFHLAAVSSVTSSVNDWIGTHQTNLTGTINIFNEIKKMQREKSIPAVYASSAAVYGESGDDPLKETDPTRPLTPYGADKLGCELHARAATHLFKVPTTGLRLFNVYGPRQNPQSQYSGVITLFINQIKQGENLKIFGDGEQARDFIYVGDVVNSFIAAMQKHHQENQPSCNVSNVCTGKKTTINQLAKTIAAVFNQQLTIDYQPPRPGDIKISCGNPTHFNKFIKLATTTDLFAGLQQSFKYK